MVGLGTVCPDSAYQANAAWTIDGLIYLMMLMMKKKKMMMKKKKKINMQMMMGWRRIVLQLQI